MRRVVIVGIGVVAPNGVGVTEFELALRKGRSGVRRIPGLDERGYRCQVAGVPRGTEALAEAAFEEIVLRGMNTGHRFAALAALEAWNDAGLEVPRPHSPVDWDSGAVIGTGLGGGDTFVEAVHAIDEGRVRHLGSRSVEKVMASGISARIGGLLALGNQVTTNSSACATGSESVLMGAQHVAAGLAERMVCGSSEGVCEYIWGGFDAMRVLSARFNDAPHRASRPMSASACGFVPAAGAGVLVLESLDSARARGAHIHAEVLGGAAMCGGHRGGGTMTSPNPESVRRCIDAALARSGVGIGEIDAVVGHLTGTNGDAKEIQAVAAAFGGPGGLPPVMATKSMIGHALSAAASIELVASVLMLERGFLHPSINCEDLSPEIEPFQASIVREARDAPDLETIAKTSLGFGDVVVSLVLRRWSGE